MAVFTRAEYLGRLAKTKARMEAAGFDLLFVTDPANIFYLSGYDAWSFYVPQALIVATDSEEPVWVGRGMDVNGARQTAFMAHGNLVGYPDDYVQSPVKHPAEVMAALIRERGWGKRRIGVELDGYYFSPRAYQTLQAELPEATFGDAGTLVNWVRVVKSPQELEYIGQAAQIVERVMRAAVDAIGPGVRQSDVAATIYQAQIAGTEEFGGMYTSSPPFIPTGKNSSAPHLMWTDERYAVGETTPMELVACRHRYHAPLGRTVFLGTPPADVLRVAEGVVEGLTAALAAIRPGVACEEVEAVWRTTAARFGIEKPSRLGYSFGVAYPPTWGDRTLSLRPGDRTVLEAGMTLHVIPGIWLADWGVVITESIRVTETGCQPLCSLPRELFVKA